MLGANCGHTTQVASPWQSTGHTPLPQRLLLPPWCDSLRSTETLAFSGHLPTGPSGTSPHTVREPGTPGRAGKPGPCSGRATNSKPQDRHSTLPATWRRPHSVCRQTALTAPNNRGKATCLGTVPQAICGRQEGGRVHPPFLPSTVSSVSVSSQEGREGHVHSLLSVTAMVPHKASLCLPSTD